MKLSALLTKKEGERLDFKQTISDHYKIAKTISAFANTNGGTLVIGVKDDKTVIGIDPEEEKYILTTAAEFYCDPPVVLEFAELEEEDKTVLLVKIKTSDFKPHYIRDKNNIRHAYIRNKDKSIPAGKKTIKLMHKGLSFEKKSEKNARSNQKSYSFNEGKLLAFLEKHEKITLKQYMQMVNISKRRAVKILNDLIEQGTIKIHEQEKEHYYTL